MLETLVGGWVRVNGEDPCLCTVLWTSCEQVGYVGGQPVQNQHLPVHDEPRR